MIAQRSKPLGIYGEFDQIRQETKRIRQSWSPEERWKRLLRGREKRAQILSLVTSREDIRGQAG